MATFAKQVLSNSSNGKQILVTTTSASFTSVHTAVAGSSSYDEVWLYAYNDSTASLTLSVLWGGTLEPGDVTRTVIPAKSGRTSVIDGKLLQNSLTIQAYADVANVILLDGFVNNISNDPTSSIETIVSNWAERVKFNGGPAPATATQIAMSNFYRNMRGSGLWDKMQMVNCIAPDNATASLTPLLGDYLWDTSAITITDLPNGLNGSGGSSFYNTHYNPYRQALHSASAGISIYASKVTGSDNGYDFGVTDASGYTMFAVKICDTALSSGYSRAHLFNGLSGSTAIVKCPGRGFYSSNRINSASLNPSMSLSMYYSNSTASLYLLSSGSIALTGSAGLRSPLDVDGVYLGAVKLLPASVFGSHTNTYSFVAIHQGLNESEARVFSGYVQTLREALGGGYV